MKRVVGLLVSILLFAGLAVAQPSQVQTQSVVRDSTPTISNAAIYTAGDLIGGKITITNASRPSALSGVLHSVAITDLGAQASDIDIVIFSSDPSGTTFTDNAAFDIADADLTKVVCVVQITSDSALVDNSVSFNHGANCVFVTTGGPNLYAALVARGTPTYTSTTDLTVRFGILQD